MKLVLSEYSIEYELDENKINILTVEKPKAFADILKNLWNQHNGVDGSAILSDKDKLYKIATNAECVYNPFDINCNDKKIITKIYQELLNSANERFAKKIEEVNNSIINFVDDVIQTVPYMLIQELQVDLNAVFKIVNVKVDCEAASLAENLINYVRLVHQVLHKNIFIFINLKQYMEQCELLSFYEFILYEKVYCLIIEGNETKPMEKEKHLVIDKDLCCILY